ncbi:Calcineurin-like metallo-phosphoesterase superfamily protein [Heracleum sosnowskyi]|uniref:Calcineurin-like metallo-phosphoesterase superfamily protein n=1 Tax=Heracleum sosnowskyi TaxID=360622 RepID=A0AAD8IVV4_9APIA|nr:Calcineurin-like metallo-phosphoesterase superfamily protein [Heracleum sosnowskyi]
MALIKLLPFIIIIILIIYEDRISTPSCKLVPSSNPPEKVAGENCQNSGEDDLKVMIVANLLLLVSEAGYFNFFFRDYYLSKFFKKSSQLLKPDMLLVLGDVSARGAELTRSNWSSVIQQFHSMLGPFLGLPYHVLLGDRDIGGCSDLNSRSVRWISSKFPGLDSSGCSAFRISNISFVSLNSVPLLCGDNSIRFSVEKTVETENTELQKETEETELKQVAKDVTLKDFSWRKNALSSGSGPVLLLHMPLHLRANNYQDSTMYDENPESIHWDATRTESRGLAGVGPYELWHNLPPNATEYIFQALKPSSSFTCTTF